jgi:hypothetical protein
MALPPEMRASVMEQEQIGSNPIKATMNKCSEIKTYNKMETLKWLSEKEVSRINKLWILFNEMNELCSEKNYEEVEEAINEKCGEIEILYTEENFTEQEFYFVAHKFPFLDLIFEDYIS